MRAQQGALVAFSVVYSVAGRMQLVGEEASTRNGQFVVVAIS
jgi:hypothetical protein